jgi:hypothetical protein
LREGRSCAFGVARRLEDRRPNDRLTEYGGVHRVLREHEYPVGPPRVGLGAQCDGDQYRPGQQDRVASMEVVYGGPLIGVS